MTIVTSVLAYRKAQDSGLLTEQKLQMMDLYCKAYDSGLMDDGMSANEAIAFALDIDHPVLKLVSSANHLNKLQAPLRERGFIEVSKVRDCKIKGTKAQVDVLTFGAGSAPYKTKSNKKKLDEIWEIADFLRNNKFRSIVEFNEKLDQIKELSK